MYIQLEHQFSLVAQSCLTLCNPLHYLAWRIPWTEEPGEPQSMRSQRVGHD